MTFILNLLNGLVKRPLVLLFIIAAILLMLLINTCNSNRQLKRDIKAAQVELKKEEQRSINNLKALHDTVTYLRKDSLYTKRVLAAKQGEIENLDKELADVVTKIKTVTVTKEVPKFVYITDINSNVSTSDVETKLDVQGDTMSIGILSSNPLFNIRTQTWFALLPDSAKKQLNLQFIDKFGTGKPSHLDFNLKFKLQLVQTEMPDGSKRVYVKPVDLNGNAIDPALLNIGNIKGVDFVDVQPTPASPPIIKKKPRFSLSIGPQFGFRIDNNQIKPYVGVGIGFGVNLLR
jgi:hypothetical protein